MKYRDSVQKTIRKLDSARRWTGLVFKNQVNALFGLLLSKQNPFKLRLSESKLETE